MKGILSACGDWDGAINEATSIGHASQPCGHETLWTRQGINPSARAVRWRCAAGRGAMLHASRLRRYRR